MLNRLVHLNENKLVKKHAKRGILFSAPNVSIPYNLIDLYNQGRPSNWSIDPASAKLTEFKLFSTGDAFSLLSPNVDINDANVNIHVGLEHEIYSPLVLLHEALQLCRCVSEHGAGKITIALPEALHPIHNPNDFNILIFNLFEASGANKIYYYDKHYTGVIDQTNLKMTISIENETLLNYLDYSDNSKIDKQALSLSRKSFLRSILHKYDSEHSNSINILIDQSTPPEIKVPDNLNKLHVILCCSANKPLSDKIAKSLLEHGENLKIYMINGTGENAAIPDEADICGATVTIVQSTRPNPDNIKDTEEYKKNGATHYFFEAAIVARQAQLRGAVKINLINPYQFSARSDKAEDNSKGKTGAYVQHNGKLLEATGVDRVISAECHDAHTMSGSYTGKNIKGKAIPAMTFITSEIATEWLNDKSDSMQSQLRLVSPDAGAAKRTKELSLTLQNILGKKLCDSRILGEKQRDSHNDNSALISSLNSGSTNINEYDRYVITDDETATGSTLCQAITNLVSHGAKNISVIIVHNNMPLDWMLRQLCVTRFIYLGANDLHFSDTQEMGMLPTDYNHFVQTYMALSGLSDTDIEHKTFEWFIENISNSFEDHTESHIKNEFNKFKENFSLIKERVKVHSLANEFAYQVRTNLHADKNFDSKLSNMIQGSSYYNNPSLLFSKRAPEENPTAHQRPMFTVN